MSYTISESEWKIMQVLWHGGSLPLKEIIEQVAPQNGWNGNTVRTLVVRLVEKGVVLAEKRGRNYRYAAAVAEQACILKETEHFLGRIFDGSPARLFSALSSGGKLTKEDCQEIEAMLRALKERE